MGIEIGALRVADPVILAPMSGITDRPFRRLAKRLGAGLVVSEMIASREVLNTVRRARHRLPVDSDSIDAVLLPHTLDFSDRPHEILREVDRVLRANGHVVHLAGYEPHIMAEAARVNADLGAAIIDINFGCPAKKVVSKLCGAALMRDEALAGRIVEAVARAVDVPVTAKMRTGWDDGDRNAPRVARTAEAAGARMITVHGRTRCQFYQRHADWSFIKQVKAAVSVPVIANGDIADYDDIDRCLAASGADGIMIGRGAQGRPWFVGQACRYLADGTRQPEPEWPQRLEVALDHYDAILEHYGQEKGVRVARKHLGWYAGGLPNAARLRAAVNAEDDPGRVRRLLIRQFSAATERIAA